MSSGNMLLSLIKTLSTRFQYAIRIHSIVNTMHYKQSKKKERAMAMSGRDEAKIDEGLAVVVNAEAMLLSNTKETHKNIQARDSR